MIARRGTYTFRWTAPAHEVFVTGAFDDWTKSIKLAKAANGTYSASLVFPLEIGHVTYMYVVDGTWVANPTERVERDNFGNENNYFLPDDLYLDP
ncbi:hypothetical protein ABW20_dc0102503 [Dactylellina cionopaga]|nr:hypothetical protein ABW20_dc0102503 [Dactylellina cionopaga]